MWVDTYKEGHVGESYATYTWRDYFAHHHARDVVSRLIHGLRNIYFRIPVMMERVPLLFLFSIGGVWIAFRFCRQEYRFLCLFLVLQMQPLVWTNFLTQPREYLTARCFRSSFFWPHYFWPGPPNSRVFEPGSVSDLRGGKDALCRAQKSATLRALDLRSLNKAKLRRTTRAAGTVHFLVLTTLLVKYFRGAGLNLRSPRNLFEILGCKTASLAS